MVINGKNIDLHSLTLPQLKAMDLAVELFLFKQVGENFEDSFKKDPKQFKKLVNLLTSFRRDIMGYFSKQYDNRYNLVNQHVVKLAEDPYDITNYDSYLYDTQWQEDKKSLAMIIADWTANAFDLGVLALAIALGISFDFTSTDMQSFISAHADEVAGDITTTTQNRVKTQIKAAMDAGEDRNAFDQRLKKIFNNPYRGRFIAQQESLNAYMQGKHGLAVNQELNYKRALSSQAVDVICGKVNGEVTTIDKPFSNGFMYPTYHFGCLCDVEYFRDKPE